MKKVIVSIFFLLLVFSGFAKAEGPVIIKWPDMEKLLHQNTDTTYVINFWATWCAPCVKELPSFEKFAEENKNKKVKILLISMDFKSQFEARLKKFVAENHIQSTVMLLDEPDYNMWIDKIDPTWSGAIPSTLIVNNKSGIRSFYNKEFTYEELSSIINPLILK